MAPQLVGASVRLAMVALVALSAALPAAAAAAAPTTTTTRRQRQPSARRAARPRTNNNNLVLAWGNWGQKRSQDQVAARAPGTPRALSDERRVAAGGSHQQPVLDSSWTHAAFRAFHEMRAGCPPPPPPPPGVDGDGGENGEPGGGGGKGPLARIRRLAPSFPRLHGGDGGAGGATATPATAAAGGGGGSSKTKRRRQGAAPKDSSPAAAAVTTPERGGKSKSKRKSGEDPSPAPPAACWHMQGRLTNTATGQTIALVEGVELARSLAFETASPRKKAGAAGKAAQARLGSGGRGAVGGGGGGGGAATTKTKATTRATPGGVVVEEEEEEGLEVDKVLKPGLWTAFGALASSKFFMYQDPATGEPMEHFRNTPVEKKQPVRTYERFSQVVSHLLQPNGRLLVVSEWGGRSVKAETENNNGVEEVEGGGGGGRSRFLGGGKDKDRSLTAPSPPSSASPRRVFNLHFFIEARTPKEERELKRWQERPGARWIAFGSPPPRAHGCKEVYSYVTGRGGGGGGGGGERGAPETSVGEEEEEGRAGKLRLPWVSKRITANGVDGAAGGSGDLALAPASSSSPPRGNGRGGGGGGAGGLMSYTRYGECPTWYGTGRMCGLDVQAKRVDSFASLPARLRQRVLEVDPDFEAGPPGTMAEVRRAAKKQRLEREEEGRRKRKRSLRRPLGSWGSSASSSTTGGGW